MIGYNVSHKIYPNGYHCDPKQPLPFAGLASQKNYMSLYLCAAYGDASIEEWLRKEFEKAGKKLDMGKCCIRFKKVEDLPLTVIAEAFKKVSVVEFIAGYEKFLNERLAAKRKPSSQSATKTASKPVSKTAAKTSAKAATQTAPSKVAKAAKKSTTKTVEKTAAKKSSNPAAAKPAKKTTRAKAAKK